MYMVWELNMHLQKKSYVPHVSILLVLWLLYNSAVGAPCSVLAVDSEVPPAFLLICLTLHRCLRALQKMGVGGLCLGLRSSDRLSQVNKHVCSEIREGRTQTQIPADELLWQLWFFECKGCWTTGVCRLARGTCGRVLALGCFRCMILNEKSDNSSQAGFSMEKQIPEVDTEPCSWPSTDLGSNKS